MMPEIREINAKSILSRSGIPGMTYCVNPYVGCAHACKYCYATFMKRFTGHLEEWGTFVDVKVNAPELLRKKLKRAERGTIMMSSVTDAYQPVEARYCLTRKCLEVISLFDLPVSILTKSPLVLRDIDIISKLKDVELGITITTDNDAVRKIFEPHAPSIPARIDALKKLHAAGISTYVFIGPVLPMAPERLAKMIAPYADRVLIDRMNYIDKTKWIYRKHKMEKWLSPEFTEEVIAQLKKSLYGMDVQIC